MKFSISLFLLCAILAIVNALPMSASEREVEIGVHSRVRRFTCDVSSAQGAGLSAGLAACARKCFELGFRGRSYCNSQSACICQN